MDWAAQTDSWVTDGLITAEQQAPLRARLEALEPTGPSLPMGPLITVLVAPAGFLMVGSVVALMAALVDPPKVAYDLVIGGSGAAMGILGVAMRFVPSVRPLGRGLVAAAIPMTVYSVMSTLHDIDIDLLAVTALIPALLGWGMGLAENSRAVTAAGSVMSLLALWFALLTNEAGAPSLLISLLCLVLLMAIAVGAHLSPSRATVLQVGAPMVALAGASILVTHNTFAQALWGSLGVQDPWSIEKGIFLLLFGTVTLLIGLAARSGWTLVPGVSAIAVSTVWVAFTVGSFVGGAVALALVSGALFMGALMLWLVPTLRQPAK